MNRSRKIDTLLDKDGRAEVRRGSQAVVDLGLGADERPIIDRLREAVGVQVHPAD
jgi:hypothetical protein